MIFLCVRDFEITFIRIYSTDSVGICNRRLTHCAWYDRKFASFDLFGFWLNRQHSEYKSMRNLHTHLVENVSRTYLFINYKFEMGLFHQQLRLESENQAKMCKTVQFYPLTVDSRNDSRLKSRGWCDRRPTVNLDHTRTIHLPFDLFEWLMLDSAVNYRIFSRLSLSTRVTWWIFVKSNHRFSSRDAHF